LIYKPIRGSKIIEVKTLNIVWALAICLGMLEEVKEIRWVY